MSRICVVSTGLPSLVDACTHHGPGLRSTHFITALLEAEIDVLVVVVVSDDEFGCSRLPASVSIGGREVEFVETTEADVVGARVARTIAQFEPDGFVGVSVMGASIACDLAGDAPLWADVFGDIMAEAQAKAVVYDNDASLARFAGLLLRVLARADRFSVVSRRQADSLVGQLGLAGRLSKHTASQCLVEVVPCSARVGESVADVDVARLREGLGLEGAFIVLWSGSFNTWCDVDTLYAGLAEAMDGCAALHFVATGGAVNGHDDRTFERLQQLVTDSRHAQRFHLVGWVHASQLPLYYQLADVAVCVERSCYERRFGSENRVIEWLAAGVPVVTTAQSEQGAELEAARVVEVVPIGDQVELATTLVRLQSDPEALCRLSAAGVEYVRRQRDFAETAEALIRWATAPVRAGDADTQPVVRIGMVSQPKTMVALLEAYVDELGSAELVRRGVRWLWRRFRRRPFD